MSDEHLGERAELYALGALDPAEADEVNAHAARCVACARLVGAAERAVTLLVATSASQVAPPPELDRRIAAIGRAAPVRPGAARVVPSAFSVRALAAYASLAASLLLVAGGVTGGRGLLHMRDIRLQDDAALAVLANAHFKHATLAKLDSRAPTSKVLWGLTNQWVYVIVDSSNCECRVTALTDAGERDLGAPLGRGTTAALFARDLPHVRRIELRRDGVTVERVKLP